MNPMPATTTPAPTDLNRPDEEDMIMGRLAPCPSCGRHVLMSETACPFCAHAFEHAPTPTAGTWARRVGRVGAIAAVAGAVAASGCGPGGAEPLYGAPAPMDAGDGDGDIDAGDGDGDGDIDAGGPMPEYGAPAPVDAGDMGGPGPEYGAPPP
jgi:hypothetical protein